MHSHNFIDLNGKKFGRLTVIEYAGRENNNSYYICKCDCGEIKKFRASHLTSERTKSCGCLNKELTIDRSTKHGYATALYKHPMYRVWYGMKNRCYNKNTRGYEYYGARGISVCEKWHSFNGFLEDMGGLYKRGLTLDRIKVNGNYEPSNCRWATQAMQSRNRTDNKYITYNGETKVLTDWANIFGIKPYTLTLRLKSGWDIEKALTKPVLKKERVFI